MKKLMFNKDHATVLHAINIVEGRMLYDKKFKEQRPKLEELIFRVNFKTEDEFIKDYIKRNYKKYFCSQ